jgi:hypothetical protein
MGVRRQGLEPRTVALRELSGRSPDVRRPAGRGCLAGRSFTTVVPYGPGGSLRPRANRGPCKSFAVIAPSARGESVVEPLSWAPGAGRSCHPRPGRPPITLPERLQGRFLGRRWSAPSQHKLDRTERKGCDTKVLDQAPCLAGEQRTPLAAVERPGAFASAMGSERVLDRALATRQALQPRSGAPSLRQQPAGETNPASPV